LSHRSFAAGIPARRQEEDTEHGEGALWHTERSSLP
jgi:hypothetical protein